MNYREFSKKTRNISHFKTSSFQGEQLNLRTFRNQLVLWEKQGKVHQLKKGIYTLNDEERRAPLSPFLISNTLYAPSYVSLESALSYYGLIPERVSSVTAVASGKTATFKNVYGAFYYQNVKKSAFCGFDLVQDADNLPVLIALPEKALLDKIYLDGKVRYEADYFLEHLRLQNYEELSRKRLMEYSRKFHSNKVARMTQILLSLVRGEKT